MAEARKGGLKGIDPGVAAFKAGAAANKAARTNKQQYDAERKRVRTDVPQWLIDRLDRIAQERQTSRNQAGAFLLAWAVARYEEDDPDLDALLSSSMTASHSINVEWDVDLLPLWERLALTPDPSPASGRGE